MLRLESKRLDIYPISNDEMRELIEREPTPDMKLAYGEMLAGCERNPNQRLWYCVWQIQLKNSKHIIGDLCFKGLNSDGMVEIGYGIAPEYQNKGYMTEALNRIIAWAHVQPGVQTIEAETEPNNLASQRVLAKCHFTPTGRLGIEGPRFEYQH